MERIFLEASMRKLIDIFFLAWKISPLKIVREKKIRKP